MREFKISKSDIVIGDALDTPTGCYITLRRTLRCWLQRNLINFLTFKFTYIPYYIIKNLTGYRITDLNVIDLDESTTIIRFDKCCKRPEGTNEGI